MQRLSLAQQIAQLEDVAPVDVDPEDVQVTGIDPNIDSAIVADNGATCAHYFDVGPSSLRKPHESLSDPKYDGAKTSRRVMFDQSDDSENDSAGEDAESYGQISEAQLGTHSVDRETRVKCGVDSRIIVDVPMEPLKTPEKSSDLASGLRKNREEDCKKGKAISRQIALWDSLLDARIRLQKSVVAGNRLQIPPHSDDQEQVHISLLKLLEEARLLSNEIFDFQERLFSVNETVQPPPRKRQRNDRSETSYAEELRKASYAVAEFECAYHPHLVQTLNKWSSKIQAVAPSVLLASNRNAFSKTSQQIKSATQLIDETLVDHSKVLARTRIYRGKGSKFRVDAIDENSTPEKEDPQVFDDTDFYHQLLRDIIDARGNKTGGNDDWIVAQKDKRAKKKVDTKASKGRKLRYEVHEKIQNFMVPVWTQSSWHEAQIDELFASLLGKGFESAMQEVGETAEESRQEEVNAALQGGYRVLG